MDEIQAAILSVRLHYLDADNARRREIAKKYIDGINNHFVVLPKVLNQDSHVWHVFVVRPDNRETFIRHLQNCGIEYNIHYPTPPHQQKAYQEWRYESFPVTEKIHRKNNYSKCFYLKITKL